MIIARIAAILGAVAVVSGCDASAPVARRQDRAPDPATGPVTPGPPPGEADIASASASAVRNLPDPATVALIRAQWRRADNRATCAPLAFTDIGSGAQATPRRANFSGGWAIAFDLPSLRSAYGIAGPGLILPQDNQPAPTQRERLRRQWPFWVELKTLPQPAFAGYGIEGAEPYPAANPDGHGLNSLAYLRVGGQTCTYNVWSRLGRGHLELLLRGLREIPVN